MDGWTCLVSERLNCMVEDKRKWLLQKTARTITSFSNLAKKKREKRRQSILSLVHACFLLRIVCSIIYGPESSVKSFFSRFSCLTKKDNTIYLQELIGLLFQQIQPIGFRTMALNNHQSSKIWNPGSSPLRDIHKRSRSRCSTDRFSPRSLQRNREAISI